MNRDELLDKLRIQREEQYATNEPDITVQLINLKALREGVEIHIRDSDEKHTMLALIETVEAAQEVQRQHWSHNETASQRRLRHALTRFAR